MNRSDLIKAASAATKLPETDVAKVVVALFDGDEGIISKSVSGGEEVTLVGFGTFFSKVLKARVATNPATGAKIQVPARTAAKFKAGKNLTAKVAASS